MPVNDPKELREAATISIQQPEKMAVAICTPRRLLVVALLLLIALLARYLYKSFEPPPPPPPKKEVPRDKDPMFVLAPHHYVHFDEIETEIYRPIGFRILSIDTTQDASLDTPIPRLTPVEKLSCDKIFADYLNQVQTMMPEKVNMDELGGPLYVNFSMRDHVQWVHWFHEYKPVSKNASIWSKMLFEDMVMRKPASLASYSADKMSVHYALERYKLTGKIGLVIGSVSPWLELLALRAGAKKVLTVEMQDTVIEHDLIKYTHPVRMAEEWEKHREQYDFIISFGFVEGAGMGRRGDPIDPLGDIREMQKAWCYLKKGGLFFLGVPIGLDQVVYNVNRAYGRIRLPLILHGYESIGSYEANDEFNKTITRSRLEKAHSADHHLFILKKH